VVNVSDEQATMTHSELMYMSHRLPRLYGSRIPLVMCCCVPGVIVAWSSAADRVCAFTWTVVSTGSYGCCAPGGSTPSS